MVRKFVIKGIVRGGKNNICITRSGLRFPNKTFARWAKDAIEQVTLQARAYPKNILTTRLKVAIDYWPGDRRTRDIPAIFDAIFHVLEKAKIVENDRQFKEVTHYLEHEIDRLEPRVELRIETGEVHR